MASKTDRKMLWAPGVIGVLAVSRAVEPSYSHPPPTMTRPGSKNVPLTLTTPPSLSRAKLCGAVIVLPLIAHDDVSSSARKASL